MTGERPGEIGQDGQMGDQSAAARDSLGQLDRPELSKPRASSAVSKTANEELYHRVSAKSVVVAMAVLDTAYNKIDLTPEDQAIRAKLWLEACANVPHSVFLAATNQHIKKSKFFPTPAEILELAESKIEMLQNAAEQEVARKAPRGMHPYRLKPPPADFVFHQSKLREAPGWRHFLDSIHPTVEHFYFCNARCGFSVEIAVGFTRFERDYILQHYSHLLPKFFMSPVQLFLDITDMKPIILFEPEKQSEEAKARVSEMMSTFRSQMEAQFKAPGARRVPEPTLPPDR